MSKIKIELRKKLKNELNLYGLSYLNKTYENKLKEYNNILYPNKNFKTIEDLFFHFEKLIKISNKRKKTNLEKYGFETPSKNKNVSIKVSNSLKEKFNNDEWKTNVVKKRNKKITKEIKEKTKLKVKETFIKKYGVDNPNKNKKILYKKQQTYLTNKSQNNHLSNEVKQILNNKEKFINFSKGKRPLEITELLGVTNSLIYKKIKQFDCKEIISSDRKTSISHNEIISFLKELNIKFIKNDWSVLKDREIDIFLPDYNLGIEYNGIYWHSIKIDSNIQKHKEKFIKCRDKGIILLQIFEHEWKFNNKKDDIKQIIMSYIKNINPIELLIKNNFLVEKDGYFISNNEYPLFGFDIIGEIEPKLFEIRKNKIWSAGQTKYKKRG